MDFKTYKGLYTKECPGCGETYEAKRTNQTFCSMRCKNRYHNNRQRANRLKDKQRENVTSKINDILWQNRQILKSLNGQTIYYNDLGDRGFQDIYLTRHEQLNNSRMRFYIYDMAYEVYDSSDSSKKKL